MSVQDIEFRLQRYLDYLPQDKNNANLLLNISGCYRLLGDFESAQNYLKDVIDISGKPHWTEQGILHLNSNELFYAKEAFMHAFAEEDAPAQRLNLSYCLYVNEEYEEALDLLNYADDYAVYDTYFLKAKILHHLQRVDEAIVLLDHLVNINEADSDVFGLLGLLHFDSNNIDQAQLFCTRSLELNPKDRAGCLVQVLLKALRKEATVSELEALLSEHPNECRLWFALGATQMQTMNIIAAEQAFFQALEVWPNFYDCLISLAWCQIFKNDLDKAMQIYKRAVELDAEGADGWGGLALVHALENNDVEAQRLLEKTLSFKADCVLAVLTQVILANRVNPDEAAKLLITVLPEVSMEIETILKQLFTPVTKSNRVLH